MAFDSHCCDLAERFLRDESQDVKEQVNYLAQAIQDTVEDWLQEKRRRGCYPFEGYPRASKEQMNRMSKLSAKSRS